MLKKVQKFSLVLLISITFLLYLFSSCGIPGGGSGGGGGGGGSGGGSEQTDITGAPSVTLPAGYDPALLDITESSVTVPASIDGGFEAVGMPYDITYDGGNVVFAPDFAELAYSYDNQDLVDNGLFVNGILHGLSNFDIRKPGP